MKVSRDWLQTYFTQELPSAEKLAEALTFHAFEIDSVDPVKSPGDRGVAGQEDWVLDVKVTPNRGHDALSHYGIAKELSAILNTPLKNDPLSSTPVLAPVTTMVEVSIENSDLCRRYIAGYLQGVKVGPSPEWLKARLEAIGQRSINNIVDATNYVMYNLGQPLHAFDAGKLSNKSGAFKIAVRKAHIDERMAALDGKTYTLGPGNLVIADQNMGKPIGIAGVKGGMPAAITEETKDLIIESANFDGVSVRKTAQLLKLRTDASTRFEQVISPEVASYAMRAAADLIVQVADGELVGFVDVYPNPQKSKEVSVTVQQVQLLLGKTFGEKEIADSFSRLGFTYRRESGIFVVSVPFERLDIEIPEDLVEEVGRIVGYDKIPAQALPFDKAHDTPAINFVFYTAEKVRDELLAKGYSEVFTSVFSDRGERVILNKVDGVRPYLRENLLPELTEALKKNIPNKDLLGLKEIKLFEIGTVWPVSPSQGGQGGKEKVMLGTVGEKEEPKEVPLGAAQGKPLDEWIKYDATTLSTTTRYQPFSKYPYIVRDIALWTPVGPTRSNIEQDVSAVIAEQGGTLLIKISLFDRFQKPASTQGGEGRTSLAFRLIFQSFERTLTEVEVNQIMEKISTTLRAQGFEIR